MTEPQLAGGQRVDRILARLESIGAEVSVKGNRIAVEAPRGGIDPNLVSDIRAAKQDLLIRLGSPTWSQQVADGAINNCLLTVSAFWRVPADARDQGLSDLEEEINTAYFRQDLQSVLSGLRSYESRARAICAGASHKNEYGSSSQ